MYYRGDLMSLSIRVTEKESVLIRKYAELQGLTVSEVMRQAILSKIEDEFDIFVFEKAEKTHLKNPKTYSIQEIMGILEIE
jgi:hypothetical protein